MILSASPSNEIPKSALYFFTIFFIFEGYVDPQLRLILRPFGFMPSTNSLAPKDFRR